jgi:hypothetical protein
LQAFPAAHFQELNMKHVLTAVAELLALAAHKRAEQVIEAQANAGAAEDYRSNAGGWN